MTLTEMRALLAAEDLRLTRSLGQNFLHDGNQLRRIVGLANLPPDARVLEIGPGLGPLTEHLLDAGARVLAIEKDARLIPILQKRLGQRPHFELLHADALEWLTDASGGAGRNWSEWHLVANLPYSVGSPILVELAHALHPPKTLVATLQSEVVDRIRARPRTPEFGLLSLLLGRIYQAGAAFRIPASCFFPAPDVESSCLRLERRPVPLAEGPAAATYIRLVKTAFTQRRKQLRKVLRALWPDDLLAREWTTLGLADDIRPEALDAPIFAALARGLGPPPGERPA